MKHHSSVDATQDRGKCYDHGMLDGVFSLKTSSQGFQLKSDLGPIISAVLKLLSQWSGGADPDVMYDTFV